MQWLRFDCISINNMAQINQLFYWGMFISHFLAFVVRELHLELLFHIDMALQYLCMYVCIVIFPLTLYEDCHDNLYSNF